MSDDEIPFNKQLRLVTREIHSISDILVNGKLAFALSADTVWAEGLLVFYEIFRYLEQAINRHENGNLGRMTVPGLFRTEAFEKDLSHYLGADWKKKYTIRPAVAKYLSHLQSLERQNPDLLIAYVYHLYMGLLSGGQILSRKRNVMKKLKFNRQVTPGEGDNLTDFGDRNIYTMKCKIVSNVNEIAASLDNETRNMILKESKNVFLLNNEIINTIEGTKEILIKKFLTILLICIILLICFIYLIF